jgi:hypothetical protein
MIVSRLVFLRIRYVSDRSCRVNQNTHFMFHFFYFAFYEIMWKNILEPGRPQMTIWRMPFACWIPKATNTHTVYVVLCFSNCNNGYTNAFLCYVTPTLPVLFGSNYTHWYVCHICSSSVQFFSDLTLIVIKLNIDICIYIYIYIISLWVFQNMAASSRVLSGETNRSSVGQEIPHILWKAKVHYRIPKSPTLVLILSQINPFHVSPAHFLKIYFNITLSPMSRSSKWSFLIRSLHKSLHAPLLSPVRVPRSVHFVLLYLISQVTFFQNI